ncbi:uncharacterized protein TNCV_2179961 [Trichonephila clavipes]|uniref:Uncharacterized protein n=1 Tax=Trichonephila clavipes TaxID=2585209 RepID=A0A8X6VUM8_TRICX|nr:uncharacterized protein TNCV_2179961 [Trichonephila clavipes]
MKKIKQLVLKQFQPTPRVLLNQFRRFQKLPNENYVQFASRIEALFDYDCKLRNVNEFNELWQLIVADQIINSLDQELTSYINIKMSENWYKPDKLGRELNLFMSSKVSNRNERNTGFRQNKIFKSDVHRKGLKGVTSVFCPMSMKQNDHIAVKITLFLFVQNLNNFPFMIELRWLKNRDYAFCV